MLPYMSSGIGAFEQVVWDLHTRGNSDIDVPALIIGVEAREREARKPMNLIDNAPQIVTGRYAELPPGALKLVREAGVDVG